MSEPVGNEIQSTTYNGSNYDAPADDYSISNDGVTTTVRTTNEKDVIELIWNEDRTLTIVINGKAAIWLRADHAENVHIDAMHGNDKIFVTGDTPTDNTLVINGNDGDDIIVGSDGVETLIGWAGSDQIWGMGGNDILYSHRTNDSRDGNTVDYLYGGDGSDTLLGGRNDESHGNAGLDFFENGTIFDDTKAGSTEYIENDDEHSAPAPTSLSAGDEGFDADFISNADNVRYDQGPTRAEASPDTEADDVASDSTESDPAADDVQDESESATDESTASESDDAGVTLGPDLPSTQPGGDTAAGQVDIFHDQLTGFYADEIAQALDNTQTYAENAETAANEGNTEEAERWANMALRESARADQLLLEARARLDAAEVQLEEVLNDPDATDAQKELAQEQFDEAKLAVETAETQAADAAEFAEDARVSAGLPEGATGSDETAEDTESADGSDETAEDAEPAESASAEPESASDESSTSESDTSAETLGPDLPSTQPGGDTAAGQVDIFHDQLTGFYSDEISQALDNAQTYAENAETAANSGDAEEAERWANMALRESARADQLLVEARARLDAAEVQLEEVLNDPDATDAEKELAQEQFDEAKLAVETAETQAADAAEFAEEARVSAGLPEDADGSVSSDDDVTTEAGAEGSESETEGAAAGAEGSEAEGEEPGSEESEAPGAAAAGESESSEDPYNEAMDNASEGTASEEADRQTTRSRSGNFLLAMAEAMGLMQAKFLGEAMKNLDIMDNLSNKEIPEGDANAERQHREAFLVAQSQFQADMQMFNIISQASATALRSTGEGMAAVVRKN